jgi:DNA polymerase-3 subunit beta
MAVTQKTQKRVAIVPDDWSATLKAVTTRKALLTGINLPAKAAARNSSIPALRCLQLEAREGGLLLSGTDLAVEAQTRIEGSGSGKACVSASFLRQLIALLPDGEVQFAPSGAKVEVRAGSVRVTLPDHDSQVVAFPVSAPQSWRVPGSELHPLLRAVVSATSEDDTRPILTGVELRWGANGLTLAATDSHRLNYAHLPLTTSEPVTWIIPANAVRLMLQGLSRTAEWQINTTESGNALRISDGNTLVGSRLIEGKFPPYERVFPQESALCHSWSFDPTAMIHSLRLLLLVADGCGGNQSRIVLTGGPGELTLTARNDDHEASQRIAVEASGEAFEAAFNGHYLLAALQEMRGLGAGRVRCRFSGPLNPMQLEAVPGGVFRSIVMPMQIQ